MFYALLPLLKISTYICHYRVASRDLHVEVPFLWQIVGSVSFVGLVIVNKCDLNLLNGVSYTLKGGVKISVPHILGYYGQP